MACSSYKAEEEAIVGFKDRAFEIMIVGLAILMVGGLGHLFKAPVQNILGESDVVYEMPRPKKSFLASLFDLGDREVSRRYVNPFGKKKDEPKKADEVKKPLQAKKAAPAAPKTAQKTDAKAKEKTVDVQIVGSDSKTTLGEDSVLSPKVTSQRAGNAPGAKSAEPQQSLNMLSGAQWRALIMAQPTADNVAKLVQAYKNKEVDEQSFYTIVTDLFRNNKSETQELGLLAVKSVYGEKSFSVTAQFYDQLVPEVQSSAHSYLLSYAVTARLPILMVALQSSNPEVVATAAQVVMDGYTKAKGGGVSGATDPRSSRGDVTTNSVASYSKFMPIFQQLSQSQDAVISGLANTALSQIQTALASL